MLNTDDGAANIRAGGMPPATGPELSVVVPTFSERGNIRALIGELDESLAGLHWEVIFVDDDSPDETACEVKAIAAIDCRVRCIQRIGRRGLSTACIEGILSSSAPLVAVIDADLQHDTAILPRMVLAIQSDHADVVIGSRYVEGGGIGDWDSTRAMVSRVATWLGRAFVPQDLSDPMSGFFLIRRSFFDGIVRNLAGLGFKILLDIFASSPRPVRFHEVAYQFRNRHSGESKLDSQVAWEYLMLLVDKLVGRYVPPRFVVFALIGGLGIGVHVTVLYAVYRLGDSEFVSGQAAATAAAIVFNYTLNNLLTYRDKRRRGRYWWTGLASFSMVCSVGALANVGVAAYLFYQEAQWLVAALAGIATGAVWNYAVTSVYTWGRPTR